MNIMFLFYTPINPNVGGVQRVTDVITKELTKRGHNVIFVATDYQYMMDYENFSVKQFFIDIKHLSKEKIKDQINRIVSDYNIQIVVSQSLNNHRLLKLITTKVGIISVCHTQPFCSDSWGRKNIKNIQPKDIKQRIFKFLSFLFPSFYVKHTINSEIADTLESFKVSDYVCYISHRFFPRIERHFKTFPQEKLIAINNPNSFDVISQNENKENLIIWVGRVNIQSKNTLDFINMWSIFHKKHPEWRAEIIGWGQDFEIVKQFIEKKAIKNIKMVGRTYNVETYYKRAKIVAVTSLSESWCLSIPEGMSFGCVPCVYDTFETVRDLIEPNKTGLIVSPSPKDMAMALDKLCNENEKLIALSSNAKKYISKFNINKIVDEWIRLFNSVNRTKTNL